MGSCFSPSIVSYNGSEKGALMCTGPL